MTISSRELNFSGYRFGFNGKEADSEGEWGELTHYDYGFRIYNPSIARFLSTDPLAREFPAWSTYTYAADNPVVFVDRDGKLPVPVITGILGGVGGFIYGSFKFGFKKGGWKKVLATTAGGFVAGFTGGQAAPIMAGLGITGSGAGVAGVYISIGTSVTGGFAGNAVEQGLKITLGAQTDFNSEEFVLSGAMGIAEGVIPDAVGDLAKSGMRKGIIGFAKEGRPRRNEMRRASRELAKNLREIAGDNGLFLTKRQSKDAAKQLITVAQGAKDATLHGTIKVVNGIVDVAVSTGATTGSEETKEKVMEDEQ